MLGGHKGSVFQPLPFCDGQPLRGLGSLVAHKYTFADGRSLCACQWQGGVSWQRKRGKQLVRKRAKKKNKMGKIKGKILRDKKTSKKTKRRKRSGMNGGNKI